MQLSGQGKNSSDSREKAGTDYRHSTVSGGHLPGTAGDLRRLCGNLRCEKTNRTGDKGKKPGWIRELYGGDAGISNLISVNSVIKLNLPMIRKLTEAQTTALEQTAEALHTEVVQAQVFPRDTGNLQNESTFLDRSESKNGKVSIVSSTPYARRLYFHPEYHFQTGENPNARGKWYTDWLPGGKEADFAAKAFKEIYRRLTGI